MGWLVVLVRGVFKAYMYPWMYVNEYTRAQRARTRAHTEKRSLGERDIHAYVYARMHA